MGEKLFSQAQFLDYLENGSRGVPGYLQSGSAALIWSLMEIQDEAGIKGDVAEIGVFHGKLFILLAHALRAGERAFGFDVFDSEPAVLGIETAEERERFRRAHLEANLARFRLADDVARVTTLNSQVCSPDELVALVGGPTVRLFSVDGDHSRGGTRHDLSLAAAALSDDGVILVDDLFNALCPGATEGIQDYFQGDNRVLEPIAIAAANGPLITGAAKLFVANVARARFYKAYLRLLHRDDFKLATPFLGFDDVLVFDFADKPTKHPLDDAVRRAVNEFLDAG